MEQVGAHHVPALPHTSPPRPADAFQRPLVPRIVGVILLPRGTANTRFGDIDPVIRSYESRRGTRAPHICMAGLCYDRQPIEAMSFVVTIPDKNRGSRAIRAKSDDFTVV